MRARWTTAGTIALLLSIGTVTACSPEPTPTPTPTGFASEEEAFAAAEETYRAYVAALNEVDLSDPATFEPVYGLSTGDLNDLDRKGFSELHAAGNRVSGATEVVSVEPLEANGTTITLDVCIDVSAVVVTDSNGNSLVDENRPDFQSRSAVLEEVAPGELLLSSLQDGPEGQTCGS